MKPLISTKDSLDGDSTIETLVEVDFSRDTALGFRYPSFIAEKAGNGCEKLEEDDLSVPPHDWCIRSQMLDFGHERSVELVNCVTSGQHLLSDSIPIRLRDDLSVPRLPSAKDLDHGVPQRAYLLDFLQCARRQAFPSAVLGSY